MPSTIYVLYMLGTYAHMHKRERARLHISMITARLTAAVALYFTLRLSMATLSRTKPLSKIVRRRTLLPSLSFAQCDTFPRLSLARRLSLISLLHFRASRLICHALCIAPHSRDSLSRP